MRNELSGIAAAIETRSLPESAEHLFCSMWDASDGKFVAQETFIVDFKDDVPNSLVTGFGASIVRLALAFYNSYGGIVVFGVHDADFSPVGLNRQIDVEAFNDVLTDLTGERIECLAREYRLAGTEHRVQVLLVPRRGIQKPARLLRPLDRYSIGTLWVRDRHSVREANESNLSMLYSDRRDLSRNLTGDMQRSVHESLPPSPATIEEFIGRKELLDQLWSWLVFGSRPRLYLHGPGGSGKSTLAYEFSRQVADRGSQIAFINGDRLDYVIYISGKETELNPYNATEQPFSLRNFDDAPNQFRAILVDSGLYAKSDVITMGDDRLIGALGELFATYSGLIVIDDVDALSRRGKDTGEESIFISCLSAAKRTRVLYTLRYPPASALTSSVKVPELEESIEFPSFIKACVKQFDVELPTKDIEQRFIRATSRLPLLTETVIGLRKVCGSYEGALDEFDAKGGEEARRYLYQREYELLDVNGRSREVLAALFLLDHPVSFTVLTSILRNGDNMIRDALSECGSIFLSTNEEKGETQYTLATPAKPFISISSMALNYFQVIRARVDAYCNEFRKLKPEEASLIVQLDRLVRAEYYADCVAVYESISARDPVIANPRVQALAGRAYSHLGQKFRVKARDCFVAAKEINYFDIFMARAWFHTENFQDSSKLHAVEVCEWVLRQSKLSSRHRAEFKSKIGSCFFAEARRARNISREGAIENYSKSIESYLSALWIGRNVQELDEEQTLQWLEYPANSFVDYLGVDIEPYFVLIVRIAEHEHDIHVEGARVLLNALRRSEAGRDDRSRAKMRGLLKRTLSRLDQNIARSSDRQGFRFLADTLNLVFANLQTARSI